MEKKYFEVNLPPFLQHDIDALKKNTNMMITDCLLDEIYGSINSAMVDGQISEEQAAYLRKKYLGIGDDEDD